MQPQRPPPIFLAPIKARIARKNFSMILFFIHVYKITNKIFVMVVKWGCLIGCLNEKHTDKLRKDVYK